MSHVGESGAIARSDPGVVSVQQDVVDVSETKPLGDLISQAASDVSTLMRKEVELAKAEIRQEVDHAKKAGIFFGVTGVLAYMAVFLLSFAAAWGLAAIMPTGWAFAIVGAIYAVAAAVAYFRARSAMKQVNPVPEQTIETLKEDVQWAKHPTS